MKQLIEQYQTQYYRSPTAAAPDAGGPLVDDLTFAARRGKLGRLAA